MPVSRKVYKRRDGTHVVTLPKAWVEILENKSGSELKEVYMRLSNEEIIISQKIQAVEVD